MSSRAVRRSIEAMVEGIEIGTIDCLWIASMRSKSRNN